MTVSAASVVRPVLCRQLDHSIALPLSCRSCTGPDACNSEGKCSGSDAGNSEGKGSGSDADNSEGKGSGSDADNSEGTARFGADNSEGRAPFGCGTRRGRAPVRLRCFDVSIVSVRERDADLCTASSSHEHQARFGCERGSATDRRSSVASLLVLGWVASRSSHKHTLRRTGLHARNCRFPR